MEGIIQAIATNAEKPGDELSKVFSNLEALAAEHGGDEEKAMGAWEMRKAAKARRESA